MGLILGILLVSTICTHLESGTTRPKKEKAPALLEKLDLFVAGEQGYFCYRIPSLIVSAKGTILAFCEARKNDCTDWDDIDLVMRRSLDGGKTWEPMRVIADDGTHSVNQPCPVVDRDTGIVWMPFFKDNKRAFVMKSSDEGQTWSKPVEITQEVKDWGYGGSGPGHGIQLKSERLLIPSWGDLDPPSLPNFSPNWGEVQFSYAFFSDDHGATWKRGKPMESNLSDECEAVETADGSVYMTLRSRQKKKQRGYAWSKDGGVTWSKVQFDEKLPESSCEGSVIRFTDQKHFGKNRILLSNPASTTERSKLTVRLSYDECRTWPVSKVLHESYSGYSDLAVASDATILCLYEEYQKLETSFAGLLAPRLILARFNLEWLTDGADHL